MKVNGQDRNLRLSKVKAGNIGLLGYMASKTDIVIVLKSENISEYLLHELFNKIRKSRTLYITLEILFQAYLYLMNRLKYN